MLGTGYLGTLQAACLAELGHKVIGVDINQSRIDSLNQGICPIHEPDLPEFLEVHTKSGRLSFTTNIADVADADIHVICVGTPQSKEGESADLSQLWSVVDALSPHIKPGALVMGRSTVPVGTAKATQERLSKNANREVDLSWNPEFLREGFGVQDTLTPDRFVFGVQGPNKDQNEATLRELYKEALQAETPVVVTDWQTAELVKVSANAFLATKISFINAISEVCEATGADVTKIAEAIGLDDRIGKKFLGAGLGFGGGCLPKDIRAFRARATELGVGHALNFLDEVDQINQRRRTKAVELTKQALGGVLKNKRVTVLGAAFKPNSDDIRDSPALDVANRLHHEGAEVTVHDPAAIPNAKQAFPLLSYQEDLDQALADADAIVLATEWKQYKELKPSHIKKEQSLIDLRNVLNKQEFSASTNFYALGKAVN